MSIGLCAINGEHKYSVVFSYGTIFNGLEVGTAREYVGIVLSDATRILMLLKMFLSLLPMVVSGNWTCRIYVFLRTFIFLCFFTISFYVFPY